MSRKRVLIISNSTIERDPRVYRQIAALQGDWDVDVVGNGEILTLSCSIIGRFVDPSLVPQRREGLRAYARRVGANLAPSAALLALLANRLSGLPGGLGKLFRVLEARLYWRIGRLRRMLKGRSYALVIGNDFHALLLMFSTDGHPGLIYDAHEYAPGQFGSGFFSAFRRMYTAALLRRHLGRCDRIMTVSGGIADLYRKEFGVEPLVAWNGPPFVALKPGALSPGRVRIVHSGLIDPKRRIERMIELMDHLDERYDLSLYLVGDRDSAYFHRLESLAARSGRVAFPPPVPMIELVKELNAYDIGLTLIKPETQNHEFGLPNKFFDFIQARLAVASWPRVEIGRIVGEYGVGVCSPEFTVESMAATLNALDEATIAGFKAASDRAARELSSERATELVRTMARELSEAGTDR